jgi:hypothetical protein
MLAWIVLLTTLGASCVGPEGSRGPAPTPSPTPHPGFLGAVEQICNETQAIRLQLAHRRREIVDAQTLVDQGTVLALKSGILSSAMRRIRALTQPGHDAEAVAHWLVTLDKGLAAYVRAVAASADRNLDAFVLARTEGDTLLATAAAEAVHAGAVWCRF